MRGTLVWMVLGSVLALGCGDKADDEDEGGGDDGGSGDDGGDEGGGDDGGDDGGDGWYATGSGTATLSDGATTNSVFTLEMTSVSLPGQGQGYHAWLSGGTSGDMYLGEITVEAEGDLSWSADTELDLLADRATDFEVWRGTGETAREDGQQVWTGSFEEELLDALSALLAANDNTLSGGGSVRELVDTTETLAAHASATSFETWETTAELWVEAEKLANGITGEAYDYDGSGIAEELEGTTPVLGDTGLIELVLSDLADLSSTAKPGEDIKDYANWAYDCVQRIEEHADRAATHAGLATVCGVESSCDTELDRAAEDLGYAIEGYDADESGDIDLLEEGTAACARYWVLESLAMAVN